MRTKARLLLTAVICIAILGAQFGVATCIAGQSPAKIGILLPFTGKASWVGLSLPAIEMAVQDVNEVGGAAGHPIELIVRDTRSSTSGAVSGTKTALQAGAIAIIGPTSIGIHSVMSLAREAGVVEISPTAGLTTLDNQGGEYVFRTVASDTALGAGMVKKAEELGAQTAGLFFNTTEEATSIGSAVREGCKVVGIEITGEVEWIPGQGSYRCELLDVLGDNPEVVFFEAETEDGRIIFEQWQTLGLAPEATWIGPDHVTDSLLEPSWPNSKGTYGVLPGPLLTGRFQDWKHRLEEYRGEEGVPTFSTNGWDAMNIIALAIEKTGEPTAEGIKKNIRKVANPPGEKVTTFEQGKKARAFRG